MNLIDNLKNYQLSLQYPDSLNESEDSPPLSNFPDAPVSVSQVLSSPSHMSSGNRTSKTSSATSSVHSHKIEDNALPLNLEHLDDDHMSNDCDCEDEQDYQEIDDNHESKYEPRRHNQGLHYQQSFQYHSQQPPQIRIERRVFHRPSVNSSLSSTTVGSQEDVLNRTTGRFSDESDNIGFRNSTFEYADVEDMDDRKDDPDSTLDADWHLEPPDGSPILRHSRGSDQKSPILSRFGVVMSSQDSGNEIIIPTMTFNAKSPPPMLKSRAPPTTTEPIPIESTPPTRGDTYSALATLPRHRCKAGGKIEISDHGRGSGGYRSIYSRQGTRDDTGTIPVEHARDEAARVRLSQPRPPTPPIRRLPSLVSIWIPSGK